MLPIFGLMQSYNNLYFELYTPQPYMALKMVSNMIFKIFLSISIIFQAGLA